MTSAQRAHHLGDIKKRKEKPLSLFFALLNRLDVKIEI